MGVSDELLFPDNLLTQNKPPLLLVVLFKNGLGRSPSGRQFVDTIKELQFVLIN